MWPFHFRKQGSAAQDNPSAETSDAGASLPALTEQLSKFIRWSYRNQKALAESLHNIEQALANVSSEAERQREVGAQQSDNTALRLIAWLDDLDALCAPPAEPPAEWISLFSKWAGNLQDALSQYGFDDMDILGKIYDPRQAEALGTTHEYDPTDSHPAPYQVVRILRRGLTKDGRLYRKAQVIVYKEGEENE